MKKSLLGVATLALTLGACTHSLHQVYVSDYGRGVHFQKDKKVETLASQKVIMGFVTQTNYLNEAYDKLQEQCPKGEILGITTEHWTSHSFLSWTNKVRMQGYCKLN